MAAMVGLTGGIGSGKSTAAACFARFGVAVIDADRIAHRLTEPGTPLFAEIVDYFGAEMVDSDGRLDRKRLGRVVFGSAEQRARLEGILHPPIRTEMYADARRARGCYCILDIPLLVENISHWQLQRVLVVHCNRAMRMTRLQRRGMSLREIEQVMLTQATDRERLAVADDIINNDGGRREIEAQVQRLHGIYEGLFGSETRSP